MLAPLRVSSHVRPVMRDDSSYSRDQPVNLRQFAPRLDDVTRCRAQAAGPGRERSRPVAAAPASVNKQYWSVLFDQLIAQQSLLRVSLQPDRCQQLDSVTSAYHYRSSSSRLLTLDRCGIKSMRRATCSPFTASTSHPRPSVDRHL